MYKLVVVGGKLRGKEFILNEGENVIGRSVETDHQLAVDGVSKKHMRVTVNGDTAFVEDLGSSNGTFVNGKLIRRQTVRDGDKIALPNLILQVVHVVEKKIIVKRTVAKTEDVDLDGDNLEPPPTSLGGKMIYLFRTKLMPVVHNFNEQYEWHALVGIMLFLFIGINVSLIIFPVLRDSRRLLSQEISMRGDQYAVEVARTNSVALSRGNLDKVETNFLENAEGVAGYELFDPDGRVVRPIGKINTYVQEPFSVEALNYYKDERNRTGRFMKRLSQGTIGIARAIRAYDVNLGREQMVGIITLQFAPKSIEREAALNSQAYLESLVTSSMAAIFFFGILYFLTVKPIQEMRLQIERVLRGRQKELESRYLFGELAPLRSSVNSLLQRLRELQSADGPQVEASEEDGPYVRAMLEFVQGAQGPVMVLNGEKLIQAINPEAEDLVGMRQTASIGQSLLDAARDQGMAATLIDLCDQSASNEGVHQRESYEIGGKDIAINVAAIMGKDKFAKAFYVTFVRST